jgi:dolichol-phosphate mannosyltransferase
MTHYSVLIPQRDAGQQLEQQVPQVVGVLTRLARPYEVICIDDGSAQATQRSLECLSARYPFVRSLRLEKSRGLSVALTAGIAAARGEVLIAMEASPQYSADQIPLLVSYLSRADLVFGHRRLGRVAKAWHRVARIPRWLVWGLDVRDPTCLFWAARHEAVQGLQLARGMFRHLPLLVRLRGYRVGETYVKHRPGIPSAGDGWCSPGKLLAAMHACRRPRLYLANEAPDIDIAGRPASILHRKEAA